MDSVKYHTGCGSPGAYTKYIQYLFRSVSFAATNLTRTVDIFCEITGMVLLLFLMFGSYVLAVAMLSVTLQKVLNKPEQERSDETVSLSVIIPVRNEEKNILPLLNDLERQDVTCEIIVIDDHSEDDTLQIAKRFISTRHTVHVISATGTGKKRVLAEAIGQAKGSVIVTTDGDCRVSPGWLAALRNSFIDGNVKMVFGGVKMMQHGAFFHDLQAIEFGSLIGTAAATASVGYPTMCNGANLAFRKAVFEEVGGYEGNAAIASGDDEFLMRKILRLYPRGIHFVAQREAVVSTQPNLTLRQFIQQRLRWAGKWRHNTSVHTVLLAVYIFVLQVLTGMCLVLLFTTHGLLFLTAVLGLVLKGLVEYVFLKQVCRYLKIKWNPPAFMILQIVYPFYVTGIGLVAHFIPQRWKGRTL